MIALGLSLLTSQLWGASAALIGWSDEGMHELAGADYSVFALQVPGNTLRAQLMVNGKLVTNSTGIRVTYEAIADGNGSINSSSASKGNFAAFSQWLLGNGLAPEEGTAHFKMPGTNNTPQPMSFDPDRKTFYAEKIPVLPIDDSGHVNEFPLFRLVARDSANRILATTKVATAVSDHMDCRSCHGSGAAQTVARPNRGWIWDCDPERDFKLNILLKHDDHHLGSSVYADVLQQAGYNPAGLFATVTQDAKPILCVRCHQSNAQPDSGLAGMRPLTQLMHAKHSFVTDPDRGLPLSLYTDSAVCLKCHAGSPKSYLRGVHHRTVTADGAPAMQCQNCHGTLLALARPGRQGWLEQPNCQGCHTGTWLSNNGQIRYTNIFAADGSIRQAVNSTFATTSGAPTPGLDLFQHSVGHGGLQCSACHGTAHAEVSTLQTNENLQFQTLQGSAGTLMICTPCHTTTPTTVTGGPHGMHSVGQSWVTLHHDLAAHGDPNCRACHGLNSRGSVLSKAGIDATYTGKGTHHYWPGFQTSCYDCHRGPTEDDFNGNLPPTAASLQTTTLHQTPVSLVLAATDPEGAAVIYRLVNPPVHGAVTLRGKNATYFPDPGFLGADQFSYAASDGSTDSNLGKVDVTVAAVDCAVTGSVLIPAAAFPQSLVPFRAKAAVIGCAAEVIYEWDFGDGSPHTNTALACHAFTNSGSYQWTLTATAGGVIWSTNGVIVVSPTLGPPLALSIFSDSFTANLSWPWDSIPVILESTTDVSDPNSWQLVPDAPFLDPFANTANVNQFILFDQQYYRLRRVP